MLIFAFKNNEHLWFINKYLSIMFCKYDELTLGTPIVLFSLSLFLDWDIMPINSALGQRDKWILSIRTSSNKIYSHQKTIIWTQQHDKIKSLFVTGRLWDSAYLNVKTSFWARGKQIWSDSFRRKNFAWLHIIQWYNNFGCKKYVTKGKCATKAF